MHTIRLATVLMLFSLLSACASSGSTPKAGNTDPSLRDKYIHAINEGNRSSMSTVRWVNYPSDEEIARRLNVDTDSAKAADDSD